jgi:hypothetical protein
LRLLGRTSALRLVDPEPEALGQESFDARHHPLAGSPAAHVDVAVVGVAHEVEAARFQFLVQYAENQDNSAESGPPRPCSERAEKTSGPESALPRLFLRSTQTFSSKNFLG